MSYTSSRCRRPVCCASTASFLQDSASPCGPAAGAEGAAWQDVRRGAAADDLVRHRRRCLVCSTAFVAKTAPFLAVIRCVVIGIKLGGGDQSIVISPDDGHVLQASDRFIIITGELVNWSLAPFLVCSTAFHCLSLCVPLPLSGDRSQQTMSSPRPSSASRHITTAGWLTQSGLGSRASALGS